MRPSQQRPPNRFRLNQRPWLQLAAQPVHVGEDLAAQRPPVRVLGRVGAQQVGKPVLLPVRLGQVAGEFGLDPEMFVVTVRYGIVTITGSVQWRAQALGLLATIRHLEGVIGVRDRLSYPTD